MARTIYMYMYIYIYIYLYGILGRRITKCTILYGIL